jgi:hypothetical protein
MKNRKPRWIALGLVAIALLAIGLSSTSAVAAPCCSSCEAGYYYCLSSCNYTPECFDACDAQWDRCFRWCSFSC